MTQALNRWARTILRLYPRAWRDRYEDEVLALVEASPAAVGALADLLVGAARERLVQFAVAYDRSGWSPRTLAFTAGSRMALISVGSILAAAFGTLVPLAAPGSTPAFDLFIAGVIALTIRMSWFDRGTAQRRAPSRPTLVESMAWCVVAVALGALYQSSVSPTTHRVWPTVVDFVAGAKGIPFMLAAEAILRTIASDRPGAPACR